MRRQIPPGDWVFFRGDYTEEEIHELFSSRTGIEIPIERMSKTAVGVVVSLANLHVKMLCQWAFQDDSIGDKKIEVAIDGYDRCNGL